MGLVCVTLLVGATGAASAQTQPAQTQPQFRSGVVLVPLDVRVVDATGKPVTNLTKQDFTVLEDGVPQEVAHFYKLSFDEGKGGPAAQLAASHPLATAASPHRTFVFVLGRGQLNGPVKGVDAVIEFVQTRLLPADRVGLFAYLRMSTPTEDRASVIRFLEAYRDAHEDIEGRIEADSRALSQAGPILSEDTRKRLDGLFAISGIPAFKQLPGAAGTTGMRYVDSNYIRWAIDQVRAIPGEKQLVVLAQQPLGLGRIGQDPSANYLVRLSNEARASLSYINTGGLSGLYMAKGALSISTLSDLDPHNSAMGIPDAEFFAPTDHRLLAEHTGGVSAFYRYASRPLDYLDRSSRSQYLLGYYPAASNAPDVYRKISVLVASPGATLHYRHGYQLQTAARDIEDFHAAVASDRMQPILARLANPPPPSHFDSNFRSRARTLKIAPPDAQESSSAVKLALSFDPTRVVFARVGQTYRATVHVAVIADDAQGAAVGEFTRRFDLSMSESDFQRAKRQWVAFDVAIPVKGRPARIRAAVYDFDADRVLYSMHELKQK